MKKLLLLFSIITILGVFNIIYSQPSESNNKLSQPYMITNGDWIAYNLSEYLRMRLDLNAPIRVTFDRKDTIIVIKIYGARKIVEDAKGSLNNFLDAIRIFNFVEAKANYGIDLYDNNYTIIYYNREAQGGPKEIIRMEKGKLQIPQE